MSSSSSDRLTATSHRILLVALGSHGDVHPMIGLAMALRCRGHRITIVTSAHFESLVRQLGFEFIELGDEDHYQRTIGNPDLWHPRKGFRLFAAALEPAIERLYEIVEQEYVPRETLVVASGIAFGARIAQERLGVPLSTTHMMPMCFRSVYESPVVWPWMDNAGLLPRIAKRAVGRVVDMALDRAFAPGINRFRGKLGLPPIRRVMAAWWHSPQQVIALFPEWFAARQPDWPSQTVLDDFPLYDGVELSPVSDEVHHFLSDGDPPIVFTPGTAMRHCRGFFSESTAACRLLGRRGMLLTRFSEHVPTTLPDGVRHFGYVPFGSLLPHAAAIVHHGGISTLAQSLSAGIPQLIMPFAFDQFDNASRLRRLGVARSILPQAYRASAVSGLLTDMLSSEEVAKNCRLAAAKLAEGSRLTVACEALERLMAKASQP